MTRLDIRDAAQALASTCAEELAVDLAELQGYLRDGQTFSAIGVSGVVEQRMADLTHALHALRLAQGRVR
jgi:hypothetical protein